MSVNYQTKVQQNAIGQNVWAIYNTTDSIWYNQPVLSLVSPNRYTFDVSESSNNGYVLSFGTVADTSDATIESTYVTRSGTPGTANASVTLDLTNYSGDALLYFDYSTSGMGYFETSIVSSWTQKGGDLDGEAAGDQFGKHVSLSSDGNVLAVGGINNDGNGSNSGHARVFAWNGTAWAQRGSDIDGEAASDQLFAVSLSSDGTILAVGANGNDGGGNASGHVRVYNWNGSAWTQLGPDIDEAASSNSGYSTSISSDGTILAIGAIRYDAPNYGNSGSVRIVQWNGSSWTQRGSRITDSQASAQGGAAVSLSSDGNIVACGSQRYDTANGADSGRVRVFEWNSSSSDWTQRGGDLDGDNAGDFYGISVSLSSNGNILVIGGINNDTRANNGGHSRVFEWNGSTWTQLGNDFYGTTSFGYNGNSTSISSDGTIVAIGTYRSEGLAGHVNVYKWDGTAWNQIGDKIVGESGGDHSGSFISLSSNGSTLAIGAINNDGTTGISNDNRGHTRVYTFNSLPTYNVTVSGYYSTISGGPEVFYLDGSANPTINFLANESYIFVQSDSTNTGQQIVFGYTSDDTSNILTSVEGVTVMGTPGQPGAYTKLELSSGFAGPLYFYSDSSTNMGNGKTPPIDFSYNITVENGSYYLNGVAKPQIEFTANTVYYFDESHSSNDGHELVFGRTEDDSVNIFGSTQGVESFGNPGEPGAFKKLVLSASFTGVLYYYCANHSNMGFVPSYNVPDSTAITNAISGSTATLTTISTDDLTDTSIVGNSNTTKRNYTKQLLKKIITDNTATLSGKRLTLSGITLPGFSNPKNKDIIVVSANASNSLDNTIAKSDITSKNVYVVIEDNESYTFPTHDSTLTVTKTGEDTYESSYNGTTTTHSAGDTIVQDGLNVTIGSLYASLDSEGVDLLFTNHLNESLFATALTVATTAPTVAFDATVSCTGPAASVLSETFYFKTDSDIATTSTDDIHYFVDTTKWATIIADLNATTNGTISLADGGFVNGETISESFLRHLANIFFGTHLAVDLFNNETDVRNDLDSQCLTVATNISTTISSVGLTGSDGDLLGSSGSYYFDDNVTGTKNVTREILQQLMNVAMTRFEGSNLANYAVDAVNQPGVYKMPFVTGDTLSYVVTMNPNGSQDALVPLGTTTPRKFKVKMQLQ